MVLDLEDPITNPYMGIWGLMTSKTGQPSLTPDAQAASHSGGGCLMLSHACTEALLSSFPEVNIDE